MKIMMIDPWGINNISLYTNGLCEGISKHVNLKLVTNYHYNYVDTLKYSVSPIFFKLSEKMKSGSFRKVVRGMEYLKAYVKIIKELKRNNYDIVHIQWLLMYPIDKIMLKIIKKYCKKIVLTAHNVLPHVNGEKKIQILKEIYSCFDSIVVHGEKIKDEFIEVFPEYANKLIIQRHGTYLNQNTDYAINEINSEIIEKINKFDKIYIFFGNIFFNKGVDRLAEIWLDNLTEKNSLLIIAGKKTKNYQELDRIEEKIMNCENILYINKYVEDNLLNYLIKNSDLVLLPYRHASMSGIIFTAAEFKKPVLATDTGSISEYITREDSFLVNNNDTEFLNKMLMIDNCVEKSELAFMGVKLNENIVNRYTWDNISLKLVQEVYTN